MDLGCKNSLKNFWRVFKLFMRKGIFNETEESL